MRPDCVVVVSALLDQHLSFLQCVEDLTVEPPGANKLIQLNAPNRKLKYNFVLFVQFNTRAGVTVSLRMGPEISCSGGEMARYGPRKL